MAEFLDEIIMVMKRMYGKEISVYDDDFLMKSIERRLNETGTGTLSEYSALLRSSEYEAECFFYSLHIYFSRFFRNPLTFAILEQNLFPDIISGKREGGEIRIWSAGCSNGQEAYSMAMILSDLAESGAKNIRYRIFATDIREEAISAGKSGVYEESAIQDIKKKYLDKYFVRNGEDYSIVPEIKQHVSFSNYDLLDMSTSNLPESIYGDFDVVVCSNVLIYYKAEIQRIIIRKLQQATALYGYLITGESEISLVGNVARMMTLSVQTAIFQNCGKRQDYGRRQD